MPQHTGDRSARTEQADHRQQCRPRIKRCHAAPCHRAGMP